MIAAATRDAVSGRHPHMRRESAPVGLVRRRLHAVRGSRGWHGGKRFWRTLEKVVSKSKW